MKSMTLYDGNQKYFLCIFESKEKACAQGIEKSVAQCRLYPSLDADIGLVSKSAFWGERITPEALRAVSFYFGTVAGWPMKEIAVELGGGEICPLALAHKKEEIWIKTKICKELFEKISLFSSFVSHDAVLFLGDHPFVFVESGLPAAVNLKVAEGLRASKPIGDLPIIFGSLSGEELLLRSMRLPYIDDLIISHILAYLVRMHHAGCEKKYKCMGGIYRVLTPCSVLCARRLSIVS